jgi:hypothetical protein
MKKLIALLFVVCSLAAIAGNEPVRINTIKSELKTLKAESDRLQTDLIYLRSGKIEKTYGTSSFSDLKDSMKTVLLFGALSVLFLVFLLVRLFFRVLHNFGAEKKKIPVSQLSQMESGSKLMPSLQ